MGIYNSNSMISTATNPVAIPFQAMKTPAASGPRTEPICQDILLQLVALA